MAIDIFNIEEQLQKLSKKQIESIFRRSLEVGAWKRRKALFDYASA